ncbi:substrate-binding domain-containing protein [Rosenbergiella australiborealis]|uniref:Substrate-binding domain-containing protein n=1 Tax=Rosenbergiella australiborealis TaxID=1544696 RepID=A0ABS5T8I5_9GAMM|nr:DNA-binding transcriptional regulator CytR [Rosenbergiella australiborealis]MBT0727742.1 substrate-binding domain-containing protein [Rosenbergiella australiborealis]
MKNIPYLSSTTMRDVALQAGVSAATVSRVFTAPEKVSAKTRQRVEIAAHALGYPLSRILPQGANLPWRKVMVIISDITDSFYSEMIRGIEIQAKKQHCTIYLFDCAYQSVERDFKHAKGVPEGYDGLICIGISPDHLANSRTAPIVVINPYSSETLFPTVHIDNLTASFNAVDYLIQRGHQRIACLTGPEELTLCQYRRQGYLQALKRNNITLNPYYLVRGDFSFTSGISATDHLMQLTPPPDAIFCHNDKMALGVIYRAKQLGIAIPKQMSVIGFDGVEECQYADPPLSTISQPRMAQGEMAITLLMDLMEGKPITNRSYLLETELVLRQSTR